MKWMLEEGRVRATGAGGGVGVDAGLEDGEWDRLLFLLRRSSPSDSSSLLFAASFAFFFSFLRFFSSLRFLRCVSSSSLSLSAVVAAGLAAGASSSVS